MNRISICTLLLLLTSSAAAQDMLSITSIGGESLSSSDIARVGIAECESISDVDVTVTTNTGTEEVDLWSGITIDCSSEAERATLDGECRHIGHADTGTNTFTFSIQDILSIDDLSTACDSNANEVTVYALYTTANPDRGAVDGYGVVTIEFDGVRPSAPDVTGDEPSGDSQVTIEWETDEDDVTFEVIAGGSCTDPTPDLEAAAFKTPGEGSRNTTISPASDLGLEVGESGAVFIASVDLAGNRSELSDGICVSRVPVSGFCDVYTEMGGADCGEAGCSVSAPGAGDSKHTGAILFVMLGALLWTRRS